MEKKIITFFLASSINDLEYDRLAVGDFVNQLNNIYEESGVFIKLYKCESDTLDHSVISGGSQASLDELVKSSDMCFVIFWHKAGDVTFHELEVALESNKQYNKPKIVVYFKKTAEGESRSDEIKEVMRIIDEELLHYHREYAHIDSLKLGIITQLQVHGFVNADITVKNNKVMCDDKQIMTVERIPLFADNDEYAELLEKYSQASARCEKLRSSYEADNGNYKIYRDLGKAIKERDRLKADIDELTENILNIGNSIAAMTANGRAISDNIRRAIECFDAGDYDGVLEALDPDDIEKNVSELDEIENNITAERIAIVEEYRMRILALKAQARWSEVHETYVKAVAQVENRPQMPKTIMFEYAAFLFRQHRYNKCIEVCTTLDGMFGADGRSESRKKGQIENLCGLAYYEIGKYAEANVMLSSSMNLRKTLANDGAGYRIEYAETCSNLAKVYYCLDRHADAEALYNEALSVYGASDDDESQIKIVNINMSLADLYYQTNKHRQAEMLFNKALGECIALSDAHPEYEEYVADLSGRLAHINRAILAHRHSDRYFVEALKTRSKLLCGEKKAFASFLENICEKLETAFVSGGYSEYSTKIGKTGKTVCSARSETAETDFMYYDKNIDISKLEMWCSQALSIRRDLARQNPEAYEGGVADACKNLAEVYLLTGEYDKAKEYLNEGSALQKRLLSFGAEETKAALAATYCTYAALYSQKNEFELAEQMFVSALEIYRAPAFPNELARTYNHFGRFYAKFGKKQEAVKYQFDSIMLYIDLYRKSPGAYIDRLINTAADIFHAVCPQHEKSIMSEILL